MSDFQPSIIASGTIFPPCKNRRHRTELLRGSEGDVNVVLATFTDQGVKNAKESPKRAEAFRQMAETFGVTVKDIFWTQGRYDIVIVIEAPDELSATALNLSLSALGNIRTESLRAFSSADMMKIVAKML